MGIRQEVNKKINEEGKKAYFSDDNIKRFGWSEGYLVEVNGEWVYSDYTRNDNAAQHDRWRIYNSHSRKYIQPGHPSARELLLYTLNELDSGIKS